jgi:NitT/TauT family transport system substrate-binding protein
VQRRTFLTCLVLPALAGVRPAFADPAGLRIMRPLDLIALPLLVMQHDRLIERVAEAMGLGEMAVQWTEPGNDDPLAALVAGQSDLAAADLAPFVQAADASTGGAAEIRGLGAIAQRPFVLVTRNPAIRTIRDFGSASRIAVPPPHPALFAGGKAGRAKAESGPALMLQMAAAQEWGAEHYDKLDRLTVARPDAAAAAALLAGRGDIDTHFSRTPYADLELADPAIRRVMDSFDVAGPHSAAVLATTTRFRVANPMLCAAILSALQQAGELIAKEPGAAAEIYAAMVKNQDISLEDLTDLIGDPDFAFGAAPAGIMRLADFLHRTGRTNRLPLSWRELFLPEAHDLPGS